MHTTALLRCSLSLRTSYQPKLCFNRLLMYIIGGASGKETLLGVAPESSGRGWKKGVVGAANAMDFGFWRDEHLDGGGGWLDAPLCARRPLYTLLPPRGDPFTSYISFR